MPEMHAPQKKLKIKKKWGIGEKKYKKMRGLIWMLQTPNGREEKTENTKRKSSRK